MHRERLRKRTPDTESSGTSHGLLFSFLLLLVMVLFSTQAIGAPAKGQSTAGAKTSQAAPAAGDFVGQEACATCHEEAAKGFTSNPHTKIAEMHGKTGVTCEGCHGPGKAHVMAAATLPRSSSPPKLRPRKLTTKCLTCHQGQHANFERTAHGEANVSCISCHSVHHSEDKEQLLKAAQPTLCFQCHTDVKPEFNMPFHHKVEEGLIKCSDCHDPHGTFNRKNLKASTQQDAVCTKCHTETAGPFVYEHAVVKTEGCVACHFPHGGPNPRLLNRANVNTICLQCHSPSPNFTTSQPMGPVHNQAVQYQSCTICHTEVHGSNISAVFFATQ